MDTFQDGAPPADWGGGQQAAAPERTGPSLRRYLSALYRFKWLIVAFGLLGGAGGYVATRYIDPEFEVRATILLEQGTGTQGSSRGPIQAEELLQASGWKDLLRSFAIADPVVTEMGLFVSPQNAADSSLFRQFRVDQTRLRPGDYVLAATGNSYTLTFLAKAQGAVGGIVEKGAVGDSIGRIVGFQWQPTSASIANRSELSFRVQTPREASIGLISRMEMKLDNGSAFLFLTLTGTDAKRTAATLNAWVEQFVVVATTLKKKNVMSVATILD